MKTLVLAVLMVVLSQVAVAQGDMTKQYESARKQIELSGVASYSNSLSVLAIQLKKAGDLDNYLLAQAEQKRLARDPSVAAGATNTCRVVSEVAQRVLSGQNARLVALLRAYVAALGDLVKTSMQADKIEEAKAAKDMMTAAQFEIADIETKLPKVEEAKTNGVEGVVADTNKTSKLLSGGKKLEIIKATWGIDKRQADITEFLREIVRNGKLEFANDDSSDTMLTQHGIADPAWGAYKVVTITYRVNNGKKEKKEWNKNDKIVLP
jgi:hypothetical protein